MRNQNGVVAFLIVLVFIISSSCTKPIEKKPIRISVNVWPGYAHAFVAKEKGFFAKHNVDVELVLKKEITDSTELYKNGETDGLFGVLPDIIMINTEGIKTKVVYIVDYSITGDQIIGRSEFQSMKDLKGKKISFEGINSFSHIFVLRAAKMAGLDENDFQMANLPANEVLPALEKGLIDAGHTWEPTTSMALNRGYKVLAKAGDVPGVIIDILAFREKLVKERPEAIEGIIKGMEEARKFTLSNQEEAFRIITKFVGISPEEQKSGANGIHLPDIKENMKAFEKTQTNESLFHSGEFIMDFYIKRGQLSNKLNLDMIIEPEFVKRVFEQEKR